MIESHGFLAAFAAQILTMSVVYPARFKRYARAQATSFPAENLAQLYPGVDFDAAGKRFLTLYGRLNTGIALLGLLLLGWFFSYMRRQDWNEDFVVVLLSAYFVIQMLPLGFVAWLGFWFHKVHHSSPLEGKRKALLERRRLFDFVSPFTFFLAVSGYLLFTAFVIYVQPKPSPGFALIGVLTLIYALQGLVVYGALYGKKSNAFETHERRVHTIGLTVRVCVCSCIVSVVFFSITFVLDLLDMKRWMPLALSAFLFLTALLSLMSLTAPRLPMRLHAPSESQRIQHE